MNAQHTPGRWYAEAPIDDDRASPYWSVRYEAESGPMLGAEIAKITSLNTGHEEANARLIAAAPELLEACRLFLAYDAGGHEDGVKLMLDYAAALSAARTAIAKATGSGA